MPAHFMIGMTSFTILNKALRLPLPKHLTVLNKLYQTENLRLVNTAIKSVIKLVETEFGKGTSRNAPKFSPAFAAKESHMFQQLQVLMHLVNYA